MEVAARRDQAPEAVLGQMRDLDPTGQPDLPGDPRHLGRSDLLDHA